MVRNPESDWDRYLAAAHGVQTGIAFMLERDSNTPTQREKHLRTGEVVAARDLHSTMSLLLEKGLIADDEVAIPAQRRMGINASMVALGALVHLMTVKGYITTNEYVRAIAEGMEAEREAYENELGVHLA